MRARSRSARDVPPAFNGVAVRELPSFTLVWLRVAIATAALLLALRLLGQRMPGDRRGDVETVNGTSI